MWIYNTDTMSLVKVLNNVKALESCIFDSQIKTLN